MSTPGQHGPLDIETDDAEYEVVVPTSPRQMAAGRPGAGHAPGSQPPPAGDPYPVRAGHPLESRGTELTPAARPRLSGGARWGLGGLLAAAVVILLLVVSGVFAASNSDSDSDNRATGQYTQPGDPNSLRIVDKASGISYDYLGEGWKDWAMGTMFENISTVGEYIITQPTVPGGGNFIAQVTSGLLAPTFGTPGPSGFPTALAAVEESVRGNYYPQPNTPTNQGERALQIDGHDAYQRSMDLTWDVEGYDSTGERVVLLLIDTGKEAPVFFYCSFPNTHAELYPLIEQVIASIKVDQ